MAGVDMSGQVFKSFLVATLLSLVATPPVQAGDLPVSYVVLGEDGHAGARLVTADHVCPPIVIDGRALSMAVRAPAETLPQRPTQSSPALSKPSAFPVTICEASIPPRTKHASVLGRALPLAHRRIDRIVVIGDTGCRLKAADNAYQACRDPAAFAFAKVAAQAAAWKPDMVIHVGDYHYRENPCPADRQALCGGSPWGYGWDAWNADFFGPGAPLLAAAPLLLARGNHENCNRAGQGWFRLLDARPLTPGHDCNDPTRDFEGDYSAPYAVPLGGGVQVVVMDLAIAGGAALAPGDPRAVQFRSAYGELLRLSKQAPSTIMITHKPILGFGALSANGKVTLTPGNQAIQSVFATETPRMFPSGVDLLLAGHIHLWEQVSFASDHPSQFITGFSGTLEDIVPMPPSVPTGASPAPGAVVDHFSSWIDGFGFMTLERAGPRRWTAKVWNLAGQVVNLCRIDGPHSSCDRAQVH